MAIKKILFKNEAEWLQSRHIVGGSDAACIVNCNPFKSNLDLWREKTGRKIPDDLSENELVTYGKRAEAPLRELFALDYEKTLTVEYDPFNLWINEKYPFAHASLDGWVFEKETGRFGIIEFKTATINSKASAEKWKDNSIPQNYYCQILHYFAVTDATFAILTAQLKYDFEDKDLETRTKHYRIDRNADIEEEISFLMAKEKEFAELVEQDKEPSRQLPNI